MQFLVPTGELSTTIEFKGLINFEECLLEAY